MRVHALAPVVAIDLDGTSGDYHGHFLWYLNNIYFPYGHDIRDFAGQIKANWNSARGEFSVALGMDKAEYRDAKLAYRQGGLKRCMPQFDNDHNLGGIQQDVEAIRALGIQVWVTTNRPWMRLDNIDKDTKYWIDNNMGQVDGVIFSQEKYHDLIDNVGYDRILGVFDDLSENIQEAERLGLRSAIRLGDHNRQWAHGKYSPLRMRRLSSFRDFVHVVKQWKGEWDAKHPAVL
jgi:hypothetical protein